MQLNVHRYTLANLEVKSNINVSERAAQIIFFDLAKYTILKDLLYNHM